MQVQVEASDAGNTETRSHERTARRKAAAPPVKLTAADYGLDKPAYPMPAFLKLIKRGRTTGYWLKRNGLPIIQILGSDYITTPVIVDILNGDLVLGNEINARAA